MKMIVYDFEVFKYNWLVVFKTLGENDYTIIDNQADLIKFYDDNKSNILIGYNNKNYDDKIFSAIMSGYNPFEVSDKIINTDEYVRHNLHMITIDLITEINSRPSLKVIEANLGMSIEESTVDFNIDRELTQSEIEETIKYCKYDVDATEKLFNVMYDSKIKPKLMLINHFKLSIDNIALSGSQLTSKILDARKCSYFDEFRYDIEPHIEVADTEILNLYSGYLDYDRTLKKDIAGVTHKLAYGGLHGAIDNYVGSGNIMLLDVASYYPSMMIEYGYESRSIKNKGLFKDIYNQRLEYKKSGNPLQAAYKLILNSTYGAMKHEYNKLYDAKQANQVCITGQLMLVELIEKISKYGKLIQSNTDGIILEVIDLEGVKRVADDWQQKTRMKLEAENIKEIYQKDVNNYVYITDSGKIKAIGGYVNKYKGGNYEYNSTTIVDEAVVNYLLFGIAVEKTILSCEDLIKFQFICNRTNKFSDTIVDDAGNIKKINKVNRVFAVKKGVQLFKVKNDSPHKFANVPENCKIYNGHISDADFTPSDLDLDYYIHMAKKRVGGFIGNEVY